METHSSESAPIDGWTIHPDIPIEQMSARQLIQHIHFHSRAPATMVAGWSALLANGTFAFSSAEQQEAIMSLQKAVGTITQAYQHMARWLATHNEEHEPPREEDN